MSGSEQEETLQAVRRDFILGEKVGGRRASTDVIRRESLSLTPNTWAGYSNQGFTTGGRQWIWRFQGAAAAREGSYTISYFN